MSDLRHSSIVKYVDQLAAAVFLSEKRASTGQSATANSRAFEMTTISSSKLDARGRQIPKTTHGKKTARRRTSRALAKYGADHPITRAAALYVALVEEQGAVACSDPAGGNGGGAGISDGGVSGRVDSAGYLSHLQELIGDDVILKVRSGYRSILRVREVVDGCLLDGKTVTEIVVETGRSDKSTYAIRTVSIAFEAALERIASRNVL